MALKKKITTYNGGEANYIKAGRAIVDPYTANIIVPLDMYKDKQARSDNPDGRDGKKMEFPMVIMAMDNETRDALYAKIYENLKNGNYFPYSGETPDISNAEDV